MATKHYNDSHGKVKLIGSWEDSGPSDEAVMQAARLLAEIIDVGESKEARVNALAS